MPPKKTKRRTLPPARRRAVRKIAKNAIIGMAEKKYHDTTFVDDVGVYNPAVVTRLTNISQGDSDTTRDGDQVRLTSLDMRGIIRFSNDADAVGRLMVVIWKSGNKEPGAVSTVSNFGLDEFIRGGETDQAYVDQYKNDTRKNWQLLYDRTFGPQDSGSAGTATSVHFHKMIGLKNKLVQFDGAGGAANLTTKNEIMVLWFSNRNTASGQGPLMNAVFRLRYTDI